MDRQTYMKQLTRQVRWRLPAAEADLVLADYREILARRPEETETSLISDMGEPAQAARLLTQPRPYHRWLAAFGGMALCLLLPEAALLRGNFWRDPVVLMAALFILGTGTALAQFTPRRRSERSPLPRDLLFSLAGLAAVLAAAAAVLGCLTTESWKSLPPEWYGPSAHWTLCLTGTGSAAAGLLGLAKARMADRRWSALYILSLTALVLCVLMLAALVRLDGAAGAWWSGYGIKWGVIGLAGLVGTGAALC